MAGSLRKALIVTGIVLAAHVAANDVVGRILKAKGGKVMPANFPARIVYDTDGDGRADKTEIYAGMRGYCMVRSRKPTQEESDWYRSEGSD